MQERVQPNTLHFNTHPSSRIRLRPPQHRMQRGRQRGQIPRGPLPLLPARPLPLVAWPPLRAHEVEAGERGVVLQPLGQDSHALIAHAVAPARGKGGGGGAGLGVAEQWKAGTARSGQGPEGGWAAIGEEVAGWSARAACRTAPSSRLRPSSQHAARAARRADPLRPLPIPSPAAQPPLRAREVEPGERGVDLQALGQGRRAVRAHQLVEPEGRQGKEEGHSSAGGQPSRGGNEYQIDNDCQPDDRCAPQSPRRHAPAAPLRARTRG